MKIAKEKFNLNLCAGIAHRVDFMTSYSKQGFEGGN